MTFASGNSDPPAVKFGGYQQPVRGDVKGGKFRQQVWRSRNLFVANQPTPVNFTLQDVAHTFRSGHKIMVQVQSTWFPLIYRNPQSLLISIVQSESDFQKASQRVYRNAEMPSHLEVLEVSA